MPRHECMNSTPLGSLEWNPTYAESEVPAVAHALSHSEIVLSSYYTLHLVSFVTNSIRTKLQKCTYSSFLFEGGQFLRTDTGQQSKSSRENKALTFLSL